ncbi:hypothetical protein [Pseudonocardia sp. GCM10023141]|uniref:hypothetical protein n=1 Tax=Pseudonocardia sp. GCM10023141 TaxID=3252653 RepID=UPI0036106F4E
MSARSRSSARWLSVAIGMVLVIGAVTGTADAAGETYDQYSLMSSRSAGQLVDTAGAPASQWAWNPTGAGRSEIRWDTPANWNNPATGVEHFVHDGDWVYLDGYEDKGTGAYNPQRVTSEQVGDGDCAHLVSLPSHGGQQHYVRWTVPTAAYCLIADGTITTAAGVVHFRHRQIWRPATTCATRFLGTVACIEQQETWWDDNGHPMRMQIDRTQKLGRGKGPGLQIHATVGEGKPIDWTADLRYTWTW